MNDYIGHMPARVRGDEDFHKGELVKITIESTAKIVQLNGVNRRVWEGKTEPGIQMIAFIPGIVARKGEDVALFEAERSQLREPSAEVAAIPARLSLAAR